MFDASAQTLRRPSRRTTAACRAAHSEDKERYVRMLAGTADSRSALLAAARARSGHWVDTFHHYGAGSNLGPFQEQTLPANLLNNQDWNLRRTNVQINVSADGAPMKLATFTRASS